MEAARLLKQGAQLNLIGRYAEAVPLLQRAVASMPDASEPRCELALALMHLGRYGDALKELDAAAGVDPMQERQYRVRSLILSKIGRHRESLAAAETAARLAPYLPETLYTLGNAQLTGKRTAEAERTASELIRLAPGWPLSHVLAGQVAIKRKKWKAAEDANRRALQLEPTLQVALNNLGVALQGQRKKEAALEIYQQAAQLDPSDEVARRNIVHLVRPASGGGLALAVVRSILVPWTIPITLVQLAWASVQSARRRRLLRPGARLYYDFQWGRSERWVKAILLAVLVWIVLAAGEALAELRWPALRAIPGVTVTLIALAIALSPLLPDLREWIAARLQAMRRR